MNSTSQEEQIFCGDFLLRDLFLVMVRFVMAGETLDCGHERKWKGRDNLREGVMGRNAFKFKTLKNRRGE